MFLYINGTCLVAARRSGGLMESPPLWHATISRKKILASCISGILNEQTVPHNKMKFYAAVICADPLEYDEQ